MAKLKKVIFGLFVAMFAVVALSSCNKDNDDTSVVSEVSLDQKVMAVSRSSDPGTYHSIWNDTKREFVHYCQRKAGPSSHNYPNGEYAVTEVYAKSLCGLTSYMMAAHVLSKYAYEEVNFSLDGKHLKTLLDQVGTNNTAYKYLSNIKDAIEKGKLDGSEFLTCELLSTTDRTDMKSFLENAVDRNMLVLVALKADVSTWNVSYDKLNTTKYGDFQSPDSRYNPDMAYGTTSNQYLLTKSTPKDPYHNGHIVLITEVDIWGTGNGIVTYIDPLAKTKGFGGYWENARLALYSRVLDAMKANGNNNTYTALAIGCRGY